MIKGAATAALTVLITACSPTSHVVEEKSVLTIQNQESLMVQQINNHPVPAKKAKPVAKAKTPVTTQAVRPAQQTVPSGGYDYGASLKNKKDVSKSTHRRSN